MAENVSAQKKQAPCGTWPSNISADLVANGSPKRFDTWIDPEHPQHVFWCESIAAEKGRSAIMMHDGGKHQCVLPRPLSAKSKVHEYGGAAYCVFNNEVFFVLADDQRVYRASLNAENFEPKALTPEDGRRYADLTFDSSHQQLFAVCEEHTSSGVKNYLVAISVSTSTDSTEPSVRVIDSGHDFYSSPKISEDGKQLLWITWDHPNMPWDASTLWLADTEGNKVTNARALCGNKKAQSICQPCWSPGGDIVFVSDKNNWWNLYSISREELSKSDPIATCILEKEAEFATPQWNFGMSHYGFISPDKIFACHFREGIWKACEIDLSGERNHLRDIEVPATSLHNVQTCEGKAVFVGSSANKANAVYQYSNGKITLLSELENPIKGAEYSLPESISFPTTDGDTAYALFYPPNNLNYNSGSELPPLIVICHGGPTAATEASLNFKIQYWTNRGFAVADVNYRGSTGYGRMFREKLHKKWGVYDVDDVCAVVDYLHEQNRIDKNRCIIKGSSAGGYTVLAALTFRETFCAGVNIYGIGDLETLVSDTHKFEARYLDSLVGDYPEEKSTYLERSPIHSIENINCPLLIFQGLKDKVVPPQQADSVFNAVKDKGIPVAYVRYPDEAHGFRQAETITHMLDSELQFYAQVFDFEYKGEQAKLKIENLNS